MINAEIARNNYAGYDTNWGSAGIKMGVSSNIILCGNFIHHNRGQESWPTTTQATGKLSATTLVQMTDPASCTRFRTTLRLPTTSLAIMLALASIFRILTR